MKRALPFLLTGITFVLGSGCGSISSQGPDGGAGRGAGGVTGAAGVGSGGAGNQAGGGGEGGGGVSCGPVTCAVGDYCCNAACGICAPPGAACVQGCPAGGSGGNTTGSAGRGGSGAGGSAAGGTSGKGGSGQGGGSAGASGHGGGAGGATGQGGAGGAGGPTCADYSTEYAAAMPEARACTPGAANQCQVLVETTLSVCPGCSSYVNDATKLNEIRQAWTNAGCAAVTGIACPAILCIAPGPVTCAATDSGPPGGTCTIGLATTN